MALRYGPFGMVLSPEEKRNQPRVPTPSALIKQSLGARMFRPGGTA
jgi:hypothetical protein